MLDCRKTVNYEEKYYLNKIFQLILKSIPNLLNFD